MFHYGLTSSYSQGLSYYSFLLHRDVSSGTLVETYRVVYVIVYGLPNQGSWHIENLAKSQLLPQVKALICVVKCERICAPTLTIHQLHK